MPVFTGLARLVGSVVLTVVPAAVLAGCAGTKEVSIAEAYVDDDAKSLYAIVNACTEEATVAVVETANEVTLTARAPWPGDGTDCQAGVVVELTSALGQRALIDATTRETIDIHLGPGGVKWSLSD